MRLLGDECRPTDAWTRGLPPPAVEVWLGPAVLEEGSREEKVRSLMAEPSLRAFAEADTVAGAVDDRQHMHSHAMEGH